MPSLAHPEYSAKTLLPTNNLTLVWRLRNPSTPRCCLPSRETMKRGQCERPGVDLARLLAEKMGVHYFPDYCFLSLHWRGNNFHGVIHHGSGGAQTPGGQRNAARKDMPWAKADFYWTGHLHQSNTDLVFQIDHNQRTNRIVTRQALVIINPSYLKYFGGYAAAKRYGPGTLGTVPIVFSEDGSIMAQVVARGRRL